MSNSIASWKNLAYQLGTQTEHLILPISGCLRVRLLLKWATRGVAKRVCLDAYLSGVDGRVSLYSLDRAISPFLTSYLGVNPSLETRSPSKLPFWKYTLRDAADIPHNNTVYHPRVLYPLITYFTSLRVTFPHLASPYLTLLHLTSPYLTSPREPR